MVHGGRARPLSIMENATKKSKSIHRLEEQMETLSPETLRYRVLESAKKFKSSWIALGQYLYAFYKDKLYRDWGHSTFEVYCAKETGIRQQTAIKLLKSYYFLEKEEPAYLKKQTQEEGKPSEVPAFESVNALRLAKQSDRMAGKDYEKIREGVLEKGEEPVEIKKKIKYFLKAAPKKELPESEQKSLAAKKMVSYLESSLTELSNLSFPDKVLKKVEELLDLIQGYK
jgi:hypothetical protein